MNKRKHRLVLATPNDHKLYLKSWENPSNNFEMIIKMFENTIETFKHY